LFYSFRAESVRWEFNGRFIDTNFRHVIPQVTNHSLNKNLADVFLFIFSKQISIPWFARSQLDFLFRFYNKRSSLRMLRTFPDEKWPQKRFYLRNIYGFFTTILEICNGLMSFDTSRNSLLIPSNHWIHQDWKIEEDGANFFYDESCHPFHFLYIFMLTEHLSDTTV
jgi:hypothetical protein